MKKFVLIDGNSLLNRAYYATPPFTTGVGFPTNAIFGFSKFIFKILADERPEYMAVAFDTKAPTFRHGFFSDYKAGRKGMPDDLAAQLEPLKELLAAMHIVHYSKEGIEADDILGTLSNKFEVHSLVYSGDRDCYQLVDDRTDVFYTKRGVSDLLRLTAANFEEEVGLAPSQIIDLKAIMGDKSDNIPGIAGVGEKTAQDLLKRFKTLDGVYEHVEEIKGALREKLKGGRESAYLSYRLATINRNCDIPLALEDCVAPVRFDAAVKKIFERYEFKSFLGLDIFDGETAASDTVYPEIIINPAESELFAAIDKSSVLAVEFSDGAAEIFADGREYSVYLPRDLLGGDGYCGDFTALLKKIFAAGRTVIGFDIKAQMHALEGYGVEFAADYEDVSVASYLCENVTADSLKRLMEDNRYKEEYAAFALYSLNAFFLKKMEEGGILRLYKELEKPLVRVLYDMESVGVRVSLDEMNALSERYAAKAEELSRAIYEECGRPFNLNSPAQLGKMLYEKFGIAEVYKKKTGKYSTGAEILEKVRDRYPVVDKILQYRTYTKLRSTYLEGFKPLIRRGSNTVHTTFHQTSTATGRLSSSDPNLQNIPIGGEGKELRKMFVPREGCVFVDADYSQIELRLLAHFSGCKALIDAYNSGEDIHAATARRVFGVSNEELTGELRRKAKAVNFGIIYGISDFGLSNNLNVPLAEARGYIEKYFEKYPETKEYMNANVEAARKNGFVVTLTGRRRYIPEISSPNYAVRQFGERAAMNMPLQGSSADIIKKAMLGVTAALKEAGLQSKLVMQVHDELMIEARREEAEAVAEILKREMENAFTLSVPLTVEVHSGDSWYDAK